jgi:hypothetical protein
MVGQLRFRSCSWELITRELGGGDESMKMKCVVGRKVEEL